MHILGVLAVYFVTTLEVQGAMRTCYIKDHYTWTFDKYCIEVNEGTRSWTSAMSYCQSRGGKLIEIRNNDMQISIERNLRKKGHLNVGYWIGATDKDSEGHWHWLNGNKNIAYSKWASGEGPHHNGLFFGSLEDCAMIRPGDGFKWHDGPCSGGPGFYYPFLCQYELMSTTTPNHIKTSVQPPTHTTPVVTFKPNTSIQTTLQPKSTNPLTLKITTSIPTKLNPSTIKPTTAMQTTTTILTQSTFPTGTSNPVTVKPSSTTTQSLTSIISTRKQTTIATTQQATTKPTTLKQTTNPTTQGQTTRQTTKPTTGRATTQQQTTKQTTQPTRPATQQQTTQQQTTKTPTTTTAAGVIVG